MFLGDRKVKSTSIKRQLTPEVKEQVKDLPIHDIPESEMKAITPVIFTSFGNCCNRSLHDLPIEIFTNMNSHISNNPPSYLTPIAPYNDAIYKLHWNNTGIMIDIIKNYIIHNSYISICNAVNCSKLAKYYYIIPIKEYIWEEFNKNIRFDEILIKALNLRNNSNLAFSLQNITTNKDAVEVTSTFMCNVGFQLSTVVASCLAIGADKAVNEILLGGRFTPVLDNLMNDIINESESLKKLANTPDIQSHVAVFIKTDLRTIINRLIESTIKPSIMCLLANIYQINHNVFNDYAYFYENEKPNLKDFQSDENIPE